MAKVGNPFVLSKRKPLENGDHRFDSKVFHQWLEALPVGDPVHAARALYERLRLMNGLDIPVSDRLQDLEDCMPHLISVVDLLGRQVLGQAYPLTRHAQMIVGLISAIYSLAAKAYKVVLDQYAHDSIAGSLLHKQNRKLALHRTIYLLGRVQLHVYQYYQPIPAFLWHEIHFIHQYGWAQNITKSALVSIDERVPGEYTASDLYKQALLLSLAGPYRLLQGEIEQVYVALLSRAKACRLLELGKEESEDALFIVDFAVDMGARHRNIAQDSAVGKGWLFDASELSLKLAKELDDANVEMGAVRPHIASDTLPSELLAKVMLAWGIGMRRMTDRSDRLGKVVLLSGLEPLYKALGGDPVPSNLDWCLEEETSPAERVETSTLNSDLEVDEYWIDGGPDLSKLKRWEDEVEGGTKPVIDDEIKEAIVPEPKEASDISENSEVNPQFVEQPESVYILLDESDGGYHLSTAGAQVEKIKVGELIGLRELSSDPNRHELKVGVIRWLKMETSSLLDFGIELLNGSWLPVVFSQRGHRGAREYYRALHNISESGDEFLITEPFYSEGFSSGQLLTEDAEIGIQLSSILEATPSFLQFKITRSDLPGLNSTNSDELMVEP